MNRRLLVLVVTTALVVAACGARGDDEDASPTTDANTEDTAGEPAATESDPGVTDTEILVGASVTLSGVTGFLGEEVVAGIDSVFQEVNDAGGIQGRKLRLIAYDDGGDSSQMLANVRKLTEEDQVIALVTGLGDAALDYVTEKEVPTLSFGVTPGAFSSKYPTVFPIVGNALLWTQETIAGLDKNGVIEPGMKVAIPYDTGLIDISPYLGAIKESWENYGAEVVSTDALTLETGTCEPLVLKWRELGVDYVDFQSAAWFLCVQAAADQAWKPTNGMGGWPASVPTIASLAGPFVEGVWAGSNGDQPDGAPRELTEAHAQFIASLEKHYPEMLDPQHLDSPALLGYYAGSKLMVAALEAQGEVITRAGLVKWIQGVEDFDTGITPPIKSMAPDCKTGSEEVWIGPWEYDEATQTASRKPVGGYFTSPQKEEFGGKCFLTALSDKILGV
ncbi:MAG TPA: ABC transporter substrate-binding protein [Acidimicrobiales bacterium]|nr:ABC transporter substrate-binding protein [Acidimicrobiales bacterium]